VCIVAIAILRPGSGRPDDAMTPDASGPTSRSTGATDPSPPDPRDVPDPRDRGAREQPADAPSPSPPGDAPEPEPEIDTAAEDRLLAVLPVGFRDLYLSLRDAPDRDLRETIASIDPALAVEGLGPIVDDSLPPAEASEETSEDGAEWAQDGSIPLAEGIALHFTRDRSEEGDRDLEISYRIDGKEWLTVAISYRGNGAGGERSFQAWTRGPGAGRGAGYSYRSHGESSQVKCRNAKAQLSSDELRFDGFEPAFDDVLRRLD
jgi:hypothetical protein